MSATTIQFGQLPALQLRAPDGAEATITLYGAHLVSWKDVASAQAEGAAGGAGAAGSAAGAGSAAAAGSASAASSAAAAGSAGVAGSAVGAAAGSAAAGSASAAGSVGAAGSAATVQERLFLSSLSALDGSRAIRGGVPVIFPQFAERGAGMRHGFARVSTWRVVDAGEQDGAAFAVLALNQADLAPQLAAAWPHPFALTLRVSVRAKELVMALEVRNTGAQPFPFAAALHTYYLVEDQEAVRIDGVQPETLAIVDKLDQVFENIAGVGNAGDRHGGRVIAFDTGADRLALRQTGFPDAVVWNPGAADTAALADMEDEEYRRFVCIEPALLGPLTLEPGGSWHGEQRVDVSAA